jgi:predicted  nucleic acid-binding Zn-ribbon protein
MNSWIQHVKQFAKNNNMSYSTALKEPDCSKSYKSKVGTGARQSRVVPLDRRDEMRNELNNINRELTTLQNEKQEILNEISELMADQRRLINIGYDDDYYEVKYNERILNLLNRKLTRYDNRISQLTDLRELLIRDLVPTPQSSMDEEDD